MRSVEVNVKANSALAGEDASVKLWTIPTGSKSVSIIISYRELTLCMSRRCRYRLHHQDRE